MPRHAHEPSSLEIYLLGSFRLAVDGAEVEAHRWARRKSRLLVKLLALQPHHRLHREQVLELLWPRQATEAAANNLHKTIHAARRALEPELLAGAASRFLVTRDRQIILSAPSELWIDVEAFELRAARALRRDADRAACEEALALYGGELLAEDPYEEWAARRREHLRSVRRNIVLKLAAMHEAAGEPERAVGLFAEALARDHSDEEAWRRLMSLSARAGDRRAALRYFEQCRRALREELDAEPEAATVALHEQIASGRVGPTQMSNSETGLPATSAAAPPGAAALANLPHPLTSFVGRAKEKAEVRRLLACRRMVTLNGAGGIGKTRLALEVAAAMRGECGGGVWLVEAASLSDPALVAQALLRTLGAREEPGRDPAATLGDHIGTKRILLVLDNCEHLIEACAAVAGALLRACPELRILATSREALGVEGEAVWRVSTLASPDDKQTIHAARLCEYEAVELFLERVKLGNPGWLLTDANAPAVARLCRQLDGIPLAIELAAARVRVLTVEQILAKLDDRFRLLTDANRGVVPRHQTLGAAIAWSYDLLPAGERVLWRRLSVFAGGWALEAAEAVCEGEEPGADAALDLLSHLVNKSLVIVEQQGAEARYRLLETIRQYGAEKLRESPEEEQARALHFGYFLRLAEQAEQHFAGAEQRAWFERLEAEHDNLRAALEWSLREARDARRGLRLCCALSQFWEAHGHSSEGRKWVETGLRADADAPPPLRAEALNGAGRLAVAQGDFESARTFFEQSLALRRRLDDGRGAAGLLYQLGFVLTSVGDYRRAAPLYEESLALCRELDDPLGVGRAASGLAALAWYGDDYDTAALHYEEALRIFRRTDYRFGVMKTAHNLGSTEQRRGDLDRAEAFLAESLALSKELGDQRMAAFSTHVLGYVANDRGDYRRAHRLFREALRAGREVGGKVNVAHVLEGFACTAAAQGQAGRAVRLDAAAKAIREEIKMIRTPAEQAALDCYLKQALGKLDAAGVKEARARGRALTLDQAVEYALESDDGTP